MITFKSAPVTNSGIFVEELSTRSIRLKYQCIIAAFEIMMQLVEMVADRIDVWSQQKSEATNS